MKTQVIKNESDKLQFIQRIKNAEVVRPWEIKFGFWKDTRSNEQNRLLWSQLTDVSNQVEWDGHKLTPDEWKIVFTSNLKQQKAVPGIDGGLVYLGSSTSKMKVSEMCDLSELIFAFGANHEVEWSE